MSQMMQGQQGVIQASDRFDLWGNLTEAWEFTNDSLVGDVNGNVLVANTTPFASVDGMRGRGKSGTGNRYQHTCKLQHLQQSKNPYTIMSWIRSYINTTTSTSYGTSTVGLLDKSQYPSQTYPYSELITYPNYGMRPLGIGGSTPYQDQWRFDWAWKLVVRRWDGVDTRAVSLNDQIIHYNGYGFYSTPDVEICMGNPNAGTTTSQGYRSYVMHDCIRVFDRFLSDDEVLAHYNGGLGLSLLEDYGQPAITFSDSFTNDNATLLTDHGWTSEAGLGDATIESNKATIDNASTNDIYTQEMNTNHVRVSAGFESDTVGKWFGLIARCVDADNLWLVHMNTHATTTPATPTATITLYERTAGSWINRISTTLTSTVGYRYTMVLECIGSTINVRVDGGTNGSLTYTSSQHQNGTKHGFRINHTGDAAITTVDDFRVEDLGPRYFENSIVGDVILDTGTMAHPAGDELVGEVILDTGSAAQPAGDELVGEVILDTSTMVHSEGDILSGGVTFD